MSYTRDLHGLKAVGKWKWRLVLLKYSLTLFYGRIEDGLQNNMQIFEISELIDNILFMILDYISMIHNKTLFTSLFNKVSIPDHSM